jgi:phenylalanyl-tRNA synthetase beta chain
MKISVNVIRFINEHYGSAGDPAPDGVDDLVRRIGAQLGEVDEVVAFGKRFEDVLIAKVVSSDKHPNADKLVVCKIDDGKKAKDVERDSEGLITIVTGAPNMHIDMLVAWLPPGSVVPSTYDKDPFTLEARALRGVVSQGMLASARELGLGDDHSGILEIQEDIAPGTSFAEAANLKDDTIIDVENKMFTHRPDCFGWMGVAREIEGIYHRPYKSPEWYRMTPEFPEVKGSQLPLEVHNEIPDLVPRFVVVAMRDVKIGPSPLWLQARLASIGLRPINNIVDYTNFFMIDTAQPIHAYDYDKVKALSGGEAAVLTVRHPKAGETIALLNGKTIEPQPETMMVAAGEHLACVGGAIGGADTEVDDNTKNIIIEAANWDMYQIRRTAMEHGIFTDAVTRFTKGQSPLQNLAVIAKIVDEITQNGEGAIASPVIDNNHVSQETMERGSVHPPVTLSRQFINDRLGLSLSVEEMSQSLTNVEFKVELDGENLTVTAPFWRTDIAIAEDVVEEVGRLYGYDHLPLNLPKRDLTPPPKDWLLELKKDIRDKLSAAGANELLTYTFVHGNLLDKVGQNRDQAFQLSNALSPDLQYYRLSLTPSLLEKVHSNLKADYVRSDDNEFALFEINKVHNQQEKSSDEGLPKEMNNLALVFAADDKTATRKYRGAPYYQAKKYLRDLLKDFGVQDYVHFDSLETADLYDNQWAIQMAAPFEPKRAAALMDDKGGVWGVVGEYKNSVKRVLKLPDYAAGFELDVILFKQGQGTVYTALSKFPRTQQDISFKVPAATTYQQLVDVVWQELGKAQNEHGYQATLGPADIYQAKDDTTHKNITLRIWLYHPQRTLTTEEVNTLLDQIAQTAQTELQATRL